MIPFFEIFFVFPFVLFILTSSLDIYFPSLLTLFASIKIMLGIYGFIIFILIATVFTTSLINASFSN